METVMPKPIFSRLPTALYSLAALCVVPTTWSQTPMLQPSQVIEAPADPGPVENGNRLGSDVELQGNRLLLRTSSHIGRLFDRDSQGDWNQHSVLVVPDQPFQYRKSVLSGDTAVVLAFNASNQEQILGRLYVFRENQPQWNLVQTIELPVIGSSDWVLGSLDFDGKTIAAGAWFNDAVYVYRLNSSGTFDLTATVQGASQSSLGTSVAINGNTLMAGAPSVQPGGSVYVYRRTGNIWQPVQELKASDGEGLDYFGSAISLKNGRVAIAAGNADQSEEQGWDHGAVYVFRKQNGQWSEEQKLDRPPRGSFGTSLDLDGRRLAVSTPNIVTDDGFRWFSRAYAYERRHGAWSLVGELAGPPQQSNTFAGDLAIEGKRVITTDPSVSTPDPLFDGQAYEYILPGAP
jgi:hypothetical protein